METIVTLSETNNDDDDIALRVNNNDEKKINVMYLCRMGCSL